MKSRRGRAFWIGRDELDNALVWNYTKMKPVEKMNVRSFYDWEDEILGLPLPKLKKGEQILVRIVEVGNDPHR